MCRTAVFASTASLRSNLRWLYAYLIVRCGYQPVFADLDVLLVGDLRQGWLQAPAEVDVQLMMACHGQCVPDAVLFSTPEERRRSPHAHLPTHCGLGQDFHTCAEHPHNFCVGTGFFRLSSNVYTLRLLAHMVDMLQAHWDRWPEHQVSCSFFILPMRTGD